MKLEDFYFYSLLSNKSQEILKANLKPIKKQPKDILYYKGDICKDLLLIESGKVRVFLQGKGTECFTLYTLTSNELCIINTFSTIFSASANANAEVMEDLTGWLLDKATLLALMRVELQYRNYIYSLISKNMSVLVTTIEDIKFTSLKERLEDWVFSQPSTSVQITHEEIATNLGSTRSFISKLLKEMEQEGKILLKRGAIEIL